MTCSNTSKYQVLFDFTILYVFQAQYEFYEKYTLGILNNDINTVLKGQIHSETASTADNVENEDTLTKKREDIEEKIREDELDSLSDANILKYKIPRFHESKIIGKNILLTLEYRSFG